MQTSSSISAQRSSTTLEIRSQAVPSARPPHSASCSDGVTTSRLASIACAMCSVASASAAPKGWWDCVPRCHRQSPSLSLMHLSSGLRFAWELLARNGLQTAASSAGSSPEISRFPLISPFGGSPRTLGFSAQCYMPNIRANLSVNIERQVSSN